MGGVIALCSIFDLELSNISNAGTLENAIKILNFFYLHCIASNNTRLELPWLLNDVSNSSSTRKLGFRISNSKWIRELERLHTNQIYGNPFLWYPKTWFAYLLDSSSLLPPYPFYLFPIYVTKYNVFIHFIFENYFFLLQIGFLRRCCMYMFLCWGHRAKSWVIAFRHNAMHRTNISQRNFGIFKINYLKSSGLATS